MLSSVARKRVRWGGGKRKEIKDIWVTQDTFLFSARHCWGKREKKKGERIYAWNTKGIMLKALLSDRRKGGGEER